MDRIPKHADGHSSLSLPAPHSFPSSAGRSRGVTARVPRDVRLATRIRARRSRAVRAASQPGPSLPVLSRLAHFPLSPLRPLGPEKEKGADTAFGPPPPFSGEGNRGSWADLASAMKRGRTAGPEHATACRAVWRVGKRAERAPAVEGNERGDDAGRLPPLRSPGCLAAGAVSHAAHDGRCGCVQRRCFVCRT